MDRPIPAYRGSGDYVFVSYAHADADKVYPDLETLHDLGVNVWYDEGIAPLTEWRQEIADAIEGCSLFIYFVSPASVASDNCRREVAFAETEGIRVLAIHLEETELPGALRLSLSDRQAILRFRLSDADYTRKLGELLTDKTPAPPPANAPARPHRRRSRWLKTAGVTTVLLVAIGAASAYWVMPPFIAEIEIYQSAGTIDDAELSSFLTRLRNGVRERVAGREIWEGYLKAELGRSLLPRMMSSYTLRTDVHTSGDQVIVTAELHNERSAQVVMSERYRTERDDLVAKETMLQEKFALLVINTLFTQFLGDVLPNLIPSWRFGDKARAKDLLIKASTEYSNYLTGNGGNLAMQLEYLERLLEIDPDFGPAYILMATVDIEARSHTDYETAVQRGSWAAENALRLLPTRTESWFLMGQVNMILQLDYPTAMRNFEKALSLGYSTGGVHTSLAKLHLREGRVKDALANIRKAAEMKSVIDTAAILHEYGSVLMANGQYEEAIAQYDRALDLSSSRGLFTAATLLLRSKCQQMLGDIDGATTSVDAAWSIWGHVRPELFIWFLAAAGREDRARELISRQEKLYEDGVYIQPSNLFWGYYELGDLDSAFVWLERSIMDRDLFLLHQFRTAEYLDDLRDDPRHADMEALLASLETRTE